MNKKYIKQKKIKYENNIKMKIIDYIKNFFIFWNKIAKVNIF